MLIFPVMNSFLRRRGTVGIIMVLECASIPKILVIFLKDYCVDIALQRCKKCSLLRAVINIISNITEKIFIMILRRVLNFYQVNCFQKILKYLRWGELRRGWSMRAKNLQIMQHDHRRWLNYRTVSIYWHSIQIHRKSDSIDSWNSFITRTYIRTYVYILYFISWVKGIYVELLM